jgi:hypothetical protein
VESSLVATKRSVGLEVKDDVHTDLSNNHKILYQLRHTIKKKIQVALSQIYLSDLDLWKTFSNWSKVISDKMIQEEIPAQLSFVEKTSFVLASNKSSNNSNKVVGIISELQKWK